MIRESTRLWSHREHIRHISDGVWRPMYDDAGNKLNGIDGKYGVRAQKADGTYIGADFIRMQPGSSFPMHTHDGDHVLYILYGEGFVHIGDEDVPVRADKIIFIPAECPHNVSCTDRALMFLAVGHPHAHLQSPTRSRSVPDRTAPGRPDRAP